MHTVLRVVDLSHPVGPAMQVYPGDPAPIFSPAATLERDGFNLLHVAMGSQTGTHIDAPYHFRADGATVDQIDPAMLVGVGVRCDVRSSVDGRRITWADIEVHASELEPGRILLLHTGWDVHYGTPAYFEHPFLDVEAARRILDLGVRVIGIDAPSLDNTGHDSGDFPCHRLIAGAGGVIAENLTRLEQVDFPRPMVSLLPIKLEGADGAPIRAVAIEL